MKNYFSDEDVRNALIKCGFKYLLTAEAQKYKDLMNLAVEAVIGEKVGFLIKHFDGEYELDFNETWQKVKEQLPLYSVKELDN